MSTSNGKAATRPRTGSVRWRTTQARVRGLVAAVVLAVAGFAADDALAYESTDMMPGGAVGRVIYQDSTRYTGETKKSSKPKGTQVASLSPSYSSSPSAFAQPKAGPGIPAKAKKAAKPKGTKVASLGGSFGGPAAQPKPGPSLSGGGNVKWVANAGCLNSSLKSVIYQVAANFGPVTVSSTCRSKAHNKRVGGAPKSYHLTGNAADFRVHANVGAAASFIKSRVGGYKHYGGGLFHIDTGPRRPMG